MSMSKNIKKILFIFALFFFSFSNVLADTNKNLVNIYLFYSDTCPHCADEDKLLKEVLSKNDNVKLYKYEIGDSKNSKLLEEVAELFDTKVSGVPFTVIGNKVYKGFSFENSKSKFLATIDYYSKYGYDDIVGKHIGDIELPKYPVKETDPIISEYIDDYTNFKIKVPLIGTIETKKLTLPVISILIGLVDGFNPCAMWVLLFLISMLIGMKDKKRMIILGSTFLTSSALIYLLIMLAWLDVATLLLSINYVRVIIGLIAIIGSLINITSYFKHRKDNGCNVINDKKRHKVFAKVKKFTHEKSLLLAIIGVMALAISVNIVELACSAGLPVMFIQILSMNSLTFIEEFSYIVLYMIFFLLDDIIVFLIAVKTMEVTGFSTKYGHISKLVGGILLLIIGILLIFKPGWLMFKF